MKKIIVSLFCILFLQNVYAGGDDLLTHSGLGSEVIDYIDNKLVDESAIRALCVKLVQYASTHDIENEVRHVSTMENGGLFVDVSTYSPTVSDCKQKDINNVSMIIKMTSINLMHTYPIHHDNPSSCQDAMKKTATSGCFERKDRYINDYKEDGYVVDLSDNGTIVECSETDNRCVVNRLLVNQSTNDTGWAYACCIISPRPEECEGEYIGTVNNYKVSAGYKVHKKGFADKVHTLSDFDSDCRPINQ